MSALYYSVQLTNLKYSSLRSCVWFWLRFHDTYREKSQSSLYRKLILIFNYHWFIYSDIYSDIQLILIFPDISVSTHDFWQSVDWFFSHESVARISKPLLWRLRYRSSRMEQRVKWTWKLLMFLNSLRGRLSGFGGGDGLPQTQRACLHAG